MENMIGNVSDNHASTRIWEDYIHGVQRGRKTIMLPRFPSFPELLRSQFLPNVAATSLVPKIVLRQNWHVEWYEKPFELSMSKKTIRKVEVTAVMKYSGTWEMTNL